MTLDSSASPVACPVYAPDGDTCPGLCYRPTSSFRPARMMAGCPSGVPCRPSVRPCGSGMRDPAAPRQTLSTRRLPQRPRQPSLQRSRRKHKLRTRRRPQSSWRSSALTCSLIQPLRVASQTWKCLCTSSVGRASSSCESWELRHVLMRAVPSRGLSLPAPQAGMPQPSILPGSNVYQVVIGREETYPRLAPPPS